MASDTGQWSTPIKDGIRGNGNSGADCQNQAASTNCDSYPCDDGGAGIPGAEPSTEKGEESQQEVNDFPTRLTLLSTPL
eukprot:2540093-Rhodomonas_salina.2